MHIHSSIHCYMTHQRHHTLNKPIDSSTDNAYITTYNHIKSCCALNNLEASCHHFGNLFVLMLQQTNGISNIVPLSLSLTSCESCCQFICELLRMFVLRGELVM